MITRGNRWIYRNSWLVVDSGGDQRGREFLANKTESCLSQVQELELLIQRNEKEKQRIHGQLFSLLKESLKIFNYWSLIKPEDPPGSSFIPFWLKIKWYLSYYFDSW